MSISTRCKRPLLAFIAGAAMTLAFAPFYAWPVLFISLPLFYFMLEKAATLRQAALYGFFFGYGYFMAGTWWIANALRVDVAKFGWMIPFSILGLSAVLALYFALFAALAHRFRTPHLTRNLLRFAVLWVAVEYLRSIGIFGFPWNLAGYAALASANVAQVASLTGVFGLSFFVVLTGLAPVMLRQDTTPAHRAAGLLLPILLIGSAYVYGTHRMPEVAKLTSTALRIVQPNIPQAIKGTRAGNLEAARLLTQLSAGTTPRPAAVIMPETAYPGSVRGADAGFHWPHSPLLITGALRVEEQPQLRVYNSIVAFDAAGRVQASYGKHQLVPFGEFVPLRSLLPLEKITPGDLDFTRGGGVATLAPAGVPPFSPLVCYEVIFPWMAVDSVHRPAWMMNATNDGWYGDTPGPYQHFAAARMRAIEQGLPLVRAANSGISALIDPYGRVLAQLPLNARGAMDVVLPEPLPPTVYAASGEPVVLIMLIIFWIGGLLPFVAKKNK